MAYRMRVQVNVDWIGPGTGQVTGQNATMLPGGGLSGQTLEVDSSPGGYFAAGGGTGGAINSTDITNMLTALSTDISAQLNAAPNLAKMQGWISGGP